MICFNWSWPKFWIFTVVFVSVKCSTKPSFINIIKEELEEELQEWIDEKGLLKYHDEALPQRCEACTQITRVFTEGSEVCYQHDPGEERVELTSICTWTDNISTTEYENVETSSFRKFPTIRGLKVLSLTKYKIETWKDIDVTFVGLTDLEYLYLESNHITGWVSSGTQEPLTQLRVLSLANNPIAYLSENSFIWLKYSKLEYLNLKGCSNMKILDSGVFSPLANAKNMWLDLSHTILEPDQLSNLTASFKGRKNGLSVLSLAHTGLYKIPTEALENIAHSLVKLSLQGNYFSNCWRASLDGDDSDNDDCLFPTNMFQLKEINLRDSGLIDFPFEVVLNATKSLQALYLDENPIQEVSCSDTSNITYLSLKNIKRDKGLLLCANGSKCSFPLLQILDLTDTWINSSLSNFSDLINLEYLSLQNSVTGNILRLLEPLKNLKFLDLSDNKLSISLFSESFPELSKLEVLKLQSSSIYITSTSSSPFSKLTSLKILDLRQNFIKSLSASLLSGLQNLQKLVLRDNRIRSWKESIFNNIPNLKTLDLRSNWITDITKSMVSDFTNIDEIDISSNPISCESCQVAQFFETCENKTDTSGTCQNEDFNITLLNWKELMSYECSTTDNEQISLLELSSNDACRSSSPVPPPPPLSSTTTAIITTIITTLNSSIETPDELDLTYNGSQSDTGPNIYVWTPIALVPIIGGLCYWKRWDIIMFVRMFRRKMVLTMLKDTNMKKGKKESYQYDVFLSYSDRDREWILQQLIPNIEQRGHIKVCLHERDFEAGLPVLDNIIACMDHSRCVLLVLSEAFLRSHWCQFELNLAQHRLLEMQHDRLILVLLENIPRDKCSKMLRYLMLTKTYLLWPDKGSEDDNNLFWRKLKKAIGPVQDTMNVSFA